MLLATAFRIALAVIAIHIVDDNYLQPEPGTSATDHLVSGLVPLALIGLAAWAYPRLRGGWRGALALASGILGIAAGLEAVHYTREIGASGDDFTGLLALPAALTLLGIGVAELWRTRRTDGSLWWRYPRRALIAGAAVVPAFMVVVAGFGYIDHPHRPRGRAGRPPRRRARGRLVHHRRRARAAAAGTSRRATAPP